MPQQLRWLLRLFDLANSTFKADNADLRFVFLTGVTKCAQVSVFSGFKPCRSSPSRVATVVATVPSPTCPIRR